MRKEIIIKIRIDGDKDEFANFISMKGYPENKPIQNTLELIGFLEIIKQQEQKKILETEIKK